MVLIISVLQRIIALLSAIVSVLGVNINTASVSLYANQQSGYSWECSISNPDVLILSNSYFAPDASAILTGSCDGKQHFVFRAGTAGETKVTFRYVKHGASSDIVSALYIYHYSVSYSGKITLKSIQ